MKNHFTALLFSMILFFYSCERSGNKQTSKAADSTLAFKSKAPATFSDSISAKAVIPYNQLKRHLVDTSNFLSNWYYKGDTVYYPQADYSLAIVSGDDHKVAVNKYLLVCKRNTSGKASSVLVATDDDEDYSTNYSRMEYKIFNPQQFYTREIEHLREEGKKTIVKVTDRFYMINKSGGIDSLAKKPAGIVVPVFDADGEITDEDN